MTSALKHHLSVIRAWLLSVLHIVLFVGNLLAFHLPLVVARIFGRKAMDTVLSYHCLMHLKNIELTGANFTILGTEHLPPVGTPIILVSNHQAMYDIPLIMWHLRHHFPKFIAKRELQRRLPSISFALRNGEHLIIDRSSRRRSLEEISNYGAAAEQKGGTVCIFPEGTRSATGETRPFKLGGFATLAAAMPSAVIIPVTLDGTGEVVRDNLLPVHPDANVLLRFSPPLNRAEKDPKELLSEAEQTIRAVLQEYRSHHPE
ncbi:1-acyl-sn-glycerol-3-phosphate acyltransferase [bacterium]|nr:1-acyl-sn-glycerol-3-phosphate acyltransferase [bacterium]